MPAARELTMRRLRRMMGLHHDSVPARQIGACTGRCAQQGPGQPQAGGGGGYPIAPDSIQGTAGSVDRDDWVRNLTRPPIIAAKPSSIWLDDPRNPCQISLMHSARPN